MTEQLITAPTAVEDLATHDPSAGTTQQTFDRSNYLGTGVVTVNRIGANSVPVLDPPIVTGARRPFYELGGASPTKATLNVEGCLRSLRQSIPHYINFEAEGGIPNDSADASGQKNREVWDRILSDIETATRARGIYFPTADWYFKRPAGDLTSNLLPFYKSGSKTRDGMVLIGEGQGARLLPCASVPSSDTLLVIDRGTGITIADIAIDRVDWSGAGHALKATGSAASPLADLWILRSSITNGAKNIMISGNGAPAYRTVVADCKLYDAGGDALWFEDVNGITVTNLTFAVRASGGILGAATDIAAYAESLAGIDFSNVRASSKGWIEINNAATFDYAKHARLSLSQVSVPDGVTFTNIDQVACSILRSTKCVVVYSKAGIVFSKLSLRGLYCKQSDAEGLSVSATSTAVLKNLEIAGGAFETNTQNGISVVASAGGAIKRGSIHDLDCGENGQGSVVYAGIQLFGDVSGISVHDCRLYDDQVVKTQKYGIYEGAGCNYNNLHHNYYHGNITAPAFKTGASTRWDASEDVNE